MMSSRRRVDIRSQKRLLDAFFKIDEHCVSYERYDGKMSKHYSRLNFERGDAVGVLLFNVDTRSVVLVEQFKMSSLIGRRRDDPATQNGWITEVVAGMIKSPETPEQAAIRETLEETGYQIENPELICKFLSSPGGTSERIFLYFATVTDSKRMPKVNRGADEDEDIEVLQPSVNDLFDGLAKGEIDDPKLAIATYWLKDNMHRIESLDAGTVKYEIVGRPGLIIGYKTGDIKHVRGVDAWVNGENSDMVMDRFIGPSISAKIRSMGANRKGNSIVEDTIQESLRGFMGERANVDIGTVLITESGMLYSTHDVQRVFHVAAFKSAVEKDVTPDAKDLMPCVEKVLTALERENRRIWRKVCKNNLDSVLFPMMGAGENGLHVNIVAEEIIQAAMNYFQSTPNPTIREIYFLAFRLREKNACDKVLNKFSDKGTLTRLGHAASSVTGTGTTLGTGANNGSQVLGSQAV